MESKDKCLCYCCLNYDKEHGCCSKIYVSDMESWKNFYKREKFNDMKLENMSFDLAKALLEFYELLSSK